MLRALVIFAASLALVSAFGQGGFAGGRGPLGRWGNRGGNGGGNGGGHGGGHSGSHSGGNSGSHEHWGWGGMNVTAMVLQGANMTLQALVSAESTAAGASTLFDLIPLDVRFEMTNTSAVQAVWNSTAAILSNTTNLTWATLPTAVQDILYSQALSNAFLYSITLSQWGFVSPSDANAGATIYSLLSANCQSIANAIVALTSSTNLRLNTTIDMNTLATAFSSLHHWHQYRFNGGRRSFSEALGRHHHNHNWQSQPPTSQLAQLYAFLSNPAANHNCLLSSPYNAISELVQHCH